MFYISLEQTTGFAGHPCGIADKKDAKNEKDLIHSAYRFLLSDLMPFGNRAKIHLEHGGENLSHDHYETVTYWYGLPAASLVLTDEIDIGDEADEKAHNYRRFRDDEFLIPAKFTQGKSSIRIKVKCTPVTRDLYPGIAFPKESAWSELRYKVYTYVMPDFK